MSLSAGGARLHAVASAVQAAAAAAHMVHPYVGRHVGNLGLSACLHDLFSNENQNNLHLWRYASKHSLSYIIERCLSVYHCSVAQVCSGNSVYMVLRKQFRSTVSQST